MRPRIRSGNNRPNRSHGRNEPSLSRRALSLRVCEWLQWRAVNGNLKEVSCRKALLELHRRGLIPLPAAEESCFERSCAKPPADRLIDVPELQCTLKQLGEIEIVASPAGTARLRKYGTASWSDSTTWEKGLCAVLRSAIWSVVRGTNGGCPGLQCSDVAFEGARQVYRVDGRGSACQS